MQDWIPAAIGVAGTLGGTALGYRGALSISRRDRKAALRAQVRSALAVYLGAAYESVAELCDVPANNPRHCLIAPSTRCRASIEHG
jgi:hypothetical protein